MKFYSAILNIVAYVVFGVNVTSEEKLFISNRSCDLPSIRFQSHSKEIILTLLFPLHFVKASQIRSLLEY